MVWLALRMETRRGTEESPRGLCEISSSTRPVNEAKQGEEVRKGKKRERRKEKADPKIQGVW